MAETTSDASNIFRNTSSVAPGNRSEAQDLAVLLVRLADAEAKLEAANARLEAAAN